MESSGLPGRVQISEQTAALLDNEFIIEERGTIDVKGKGSMKTYWLFEHRREQVPASNESEIPQASVDPKNVGSA